MSLRNLLAQALIMVVAGLGAPAVAQCPPGQPGGLNASDSTYCDRVEVLWNDVNGATSYQVWRSTNTNLNDAILVGAPVVSGYSDITAVPGVHYYYWVRAFRAACLPGNNFGPYRGPNQGTRAVDPAAPANVQASDSTQCDGVVITWNPVASAVNYPVWRSEGGYGSAILVGVTSTNEWTDLTALPATTYNYWVTTFALCGTSGPSAGDAGTRADVPQAPTNVQATDGTECNSVSVTWSDVPGLTSYLVFRSNDSNPGNATLIGPSTIPELSDITAIAGNTYWYWVRAVAICGTSDLSNGDSGFHSASLPAPTGLQMIDPADEDSWCNFVNLRWTSPGLQYATEVWRNSSSNLGDAIMVGVTAAGVGVWHDQANIQPQGSYHYWIRTRSLCGPSEFSSSIIGRVAGTPQAPVNLSAECQSGCTNSNTILLSWDAPDAYPPIFFYNIYRGDTPNPTELYAVVPASDTSRLITDASADSSNYFHVMATNGCGEGQLSASVEGWCPGGIHVTPDSLSPPLGGQAVFSASTQGYLLASPRWQRNGVDLSDNTFISGSASMTLTIHHVTSGDEGTYRLSGAPGLSACDPIIYSNPATLTVICAADFDGDGQVAVPDIFDFLSAWFAQDPRADIDGMPGVAVPDIFAFLSTWFAGCS